MLKYFSIGESFKFSLDFVKKNFSVVMILFVFHLILSFVGSLIGLLNPSPGKEPSSLLSRYLILVESKTFPFNLKIPDIRLFGILPLHSLLEIVLYILLFLVSFCILIFTLKIAISWKDKGLVNIKESIKKIFSFSLLSRIFLGTILFALIITGCIFIPALSSILLWSMGTLPKSPLSPLLPLLGVIAIIIILIGIFLVIYFYLSYFLFNYFIIDKDSGVIMSFKQSKIATNGVKLRLFGFVIIIGLIQTPLYLFRLVENLFKISPFYLFIADILILGILTAIIGIFKEFAVFHIYRQLVEREDM